MEIMDRQILTHTGKMFDFLHPTPDMICIEDIAHALALTNRYSGHTHSPYSVAEHCVRASYLTIGDPLINLLHDSAEAYIGDIPSPQKKNLEWLIPQKGVVYYSAVEWKVLKIIGEALNVEQLEEMVFDSKTKQVDLIMLAIELRDLMPKKAIDVFSRQLIGISPSQQKIYPWDWCLAKNKFLARFKELCK